MKFPIPTKAVGRVFKRLYLKKARTMSLKKGTRVITPKKIIMGVSTIKTKRACADLGPFFALNTPSLPSFFKLFFLSLNTPEEIS